VISGRCLELQRLQGEIATQVSFAYEELSRGRTLIKLKDAVKTVTVTVFNCEAWERDQNLKRQSRRLESLIVGSAR
jgi:hypothetical protein